MIRWRITIEKKPDRYLQHGEEKVTEICDTKLMDFYLREVLPHKVTHDGVKTVRIEVLED